jgi:hypothetical protein
LPRKKKLEPKVCQSPAVGPPWPGDTALPSTVSGPAKVRLPPLHDEYRTARTRTTAAASDVEARGAALIATKASDTEFGGTSAKAADTCQATTAAADAAGASGFK